MPYPAYASISVPFDKLAPSPINKQWIIEGRPETHSVLLSRSADQTAFTVMWRCTAGKFRWVYDIDETIHFLEGSAVIDDGRGPRHFGPGDVAFFPAGSTAVWTVENYVRKLAFCRKTLPAPLAAGLPLLRAIKAMLRGSQRESPLLKTES